MKSPLARMAVILLLAEAGSCAGATYTNTIARTAAFIAGQMSAGNIQGLSIALVDGQDTVWAQGFGYADREAGVEANADTVYHVGSVSKAYLGTVCMQLLDSGQMDLEAELALYIPEYSMLPRFVGPAVTIRSLLSHHGGIPGDFFNGMITTRPIENYAAWLLDCLRQDYPFAPACERAYYCNSGFLLLSEAVARIAGVGFPAYANSMIFAPLGMEATSFLPDKPSITARMAAAYNHGGERQPPEFLNAQGSGSLYSTANDQARFIRMILADGQFGGQTIVSSNGIDVMTEPQMTNLPLNIADSPQGLGWDSACDYRFRYAGKVFWKDGGTWFHCAFLGISRDLQLGVAVIQNTPGSQCDEIGAEALRWAILDKTGQHWPTNSFQPEPSPVTNRPQAELDALAGLYVGPSGYHKIESGAGTLSLKINAHLDYPLVISNLVPRSNGWFSPPDSQSRQLAFTNLAGHAMLLLHGIDGAYATVEPVGERYLPAPLPIAWASRTNRVYRIVDMNPVEYFWEPGQAMEKTLRFRLKDGALLADWMLGTFVLRPESDRLAFQPGVHYRKGGAVQAWTTNGVEMLRYSSYLFLDESAIPSLQVFSPVSGTIPFANGTQWYWFNGYAGKNYKVSIASVGSEIFGRITDREGIVLHAGTNGTAFLACASNTQYAIAVSSTAACPFSASLTACGLCQSQNDFDGDALADLAATDSSGKWFFRFSSSGYSALCGPFDTGAAGLPATGDLDGDAKADLIAAAGREWNAWFSSSQYGIRAGPFDMGACGLPLAGDLDGDRLGDLIAVDGTNWHVRFSSEQYNVIRGPYDLGVAGVPATGDFDGDGRDDLIVANASDWYFWFSSSGYATQCGPYDLGMAGLPAAGDLDGDGRGDLIAVSGSDWRVRLSSSQYGAVYGPCSLDMPQ